MLRPCLEALQPILERREVELVWVDNGSSDGSADYVHSHFPKANTMILPRNMGVAYARNRGVELAQGDYILFLDDDTEASATAIDELLYYMDTHPEVGIAGCTLKDAQGNVQDSYKGYPGLWCKVGNMLRSKLGLKKRHLHLPQQVIYPVYVIGACQLIRRNLFDRIGLLDEAIFYGPEDADFCIRAERAGWQTAYLPTVSILHHWRRITTRSLTSTTSRRHIRALLHFWCKHRRIW